jgi:hypothetical protein
MKLEAYAIDEQVLVVKERELADLFRELDEAYHNDPEAEINDPRLLEPIEFHPEADFYNLASGRIR